MLSVITGKILPTHMCISPIEFIEVSHAYIRVGSGPSSDDIFSIHDSRLIIKWHLLISARNFFFFLKK